MELEEAPRATEKDQATPATAKDQATRATAKDQASDDSRRELEGRLTEATRATEQDQAKRADLIAFSGLSSSSSSSSSITALRHESRLPPAHQRVYPRPSLTVSSLHMAGPQPTSAGTVAPPATACKGAGTVAPPATTCKGA